MFSTIGSELYKSRLDLGLVSLARVGLLGQVGETHLAEAHRGSKLAPEQLLKNMAILVAYLVRVYT